MSKSSKRERQRLNREARREYEESLARRRRTMKGVRTFAIIAAPVIVIGAVLSLASGSDNGTANPRHFNAAPAVSINPAATYTATLDTTEGNIVIALDAAKAPNSVNNFVFLARKKFYDGLLFNRAVKDFVIQTGGPTNTSAGGPGYKVVGEVPTTAYVVGSVAWAKGSADAPGTAGSQFFIGTGQNITMLPLDYGNIGVVTAGLDVAQKIGALAPASGDGPPTKKVRIKKVTITETPPATTTTSGATPTS